MTGTAERCWFVKRSAWRAGFACGSENMWLARRNFPVPAEIPVRYQKLSRWRGRALCVCENMWLAPRTVVCGRKYVARAAELCAVEKICGWHGATWPSRRRSPCGIRTHMAGAAERCSFAKIYGWRRLCAIRWRANGCGSENMWLARRNFAVPAGISVWCQKICGWHGRALFVGRNKCLARPSAVRL